MKLYAHPVSTTSRPVLMFCQEQGVDIEVVAVDLLSGEHMGDAYKKINVNAMVPALDDDGFALTESSAILKYLADKIDSPTYPKELKARARVNEIMDWFNTNLYREVAYHMVYPQVFPSHTRATEEQTNSVVAWGLERSQAVLQVLDGNWHMLSGQGPYLTGAQITIADYLGADLLGCADLIRVNWGRYPKVERWLDTMKARPAWASVHEAIDGFAGSLAEKSFTTIQ